MKKQSYLLLIVAILCLFIAINNFNISRQNLNEQDKGYYIGKIESIKQNDKITTVEISPVPSSRYFISEIDAIHKIEYELDKMSVAGIADPHKKHKTLRLGELGELAAQFKVGDTIIFHLADKQYDKNNYNLRIDKLAVDLTLK